MTADVAPYELMKLRLLNAGHSALGYLGWLAGFRTIDRVASDPQFQTFLRRLWDDEVTPLLPPVPGIDLDDYKSTLLTRFANPRIGDQVARICLDGSAKMPKFLLPSVHEQLARGHVPRLLTLAVAGWFRYLSGTDEQGRPSPSKTPWPRPSKSAPRPAAPTRAPCCPCAPSSAASPTTPASSLSWGPLCVGFTRRGSGPHSRLLRPF